MTKCGDCIHYEHFCSPYALPDEDFWEVGGCKCFKNKADFVEVVRCKDCKRFLEYADGKKRIEGADGDCHARMMHSCDEQFWGVCFDDFCSFGERKGGEAE